MNYKDQIKKNPLLNGYCKKHKRNLMEFEILQGNCMDCQKEENKKWLIPKKENQLKLF